MSDFSVNLRTEYFNKLHTRTYFSKWVLRFIKVHKLILKKDYIKVKSFKRDNAFDYFIKPAKFEEIKKDLQGENVPIGFSHNLHDVVLEFGIQGKFDTIIKKIKNHINWIEGKDFCKKLGFCKHNKRKNRKRMQYYINDEIREKIKEKAKLITQNRINKIKGFFNIEESNKRLYNFEEEDEEFYNPVYKKFELYSLKEWLEEINKYYKEVEV